MGSKGMEWCVKDCKSVLQKDPLDRLFYSGPLVSVPSQVDRAERDGHVLVFFDLCLFTFNS